MDKHHRQSQKTGGYGGHFLFDMHLHILPGVDDGAGDMEETQRMFDMEIAQGAYCMCATPHFSVQSPIRREMLEEIYKTAADALNEKCPQARLYLGQELFYSAGLLEALDKKEALTLNCSRYVLVEFHPQESYEHVYDGLQALVRGGYVPVLAHVERLACLWKDTARLDALKAMYVPFQMNTGSLCGGWNPSVHYCRRLVRDGYIDLLGTDAHGSHWRAPDYQEAARWILGHCGEELLIKLAVENPGRVLNDELLDN